MTRPQLLARTPALLALAIALPACMPPPQGTAYGAARVGDHERWQTVQPVNVNLRFEMPYVPAAQTENDRLADGSQVARTSGSVRSRGILFGFVVSTYEQGFGGNPLDELDNMVDGSIEAATGCEVTSAEALWTSGFPGTELELEKQDENLHIYMRHYVGRSRAYVFIVGVPSDRVQFAAPARDRFFQSVVFDSADALTAYGDGRITDGTWRWLYPPEGAFAVEMPGVPTRSEPSWTIDGHEYDLWEYVLEGGTPNARLEIVAVGFGTRNPTDALDALLRRFTQANDAHVRSDDAIAHEGHGARRVVIETATSVRYVLLVRTEGAAYAIGYSSARADDATAAAQRQRFFDSFHVL